MPAIPQSKHAQISPRFGFDRFGQIEASSGIVLLVAAVVALIWANSPLSDSYHTILDTHLVVEFGAFHLDESVLHMINDGLMAILFLVVGLEINAGWL